MVPAFWSILLVCLLIRKLTPSIFIIIIERSVLILSIYWFCNVWVLFGFFFFFYPPLLVDFILPWFILILWPHGWFVFLFSPKVSLGIFCRVGLAVTNSFSLFLSYKVFIFPSIMRDSFAWHSVSVGSYCLQNLIYISPGPPGLNNLLFFWWACLYIWLSVSHLKLSIYFLCFVYLVF